MIVAEVTPIASDVGIKRKVKTLCVIDVFICHHYLFSKTIVSVAPPQLEKL